MWTAVALAFAMTGFGPPWPTSHYYRLQDWDLRVIHDRFAGSVSCFIHAGRVRFNRDTLIFPMGRDAETVDAFFRVDGGSPRNVREVVAEDQARGFFPDRGWVENPSEREVALPASTVRGARMVYIRANPHSVPRRFRVGGLAEMLRAANGLGCAARPI